MRWLMLGMIALGMASAASRLPDPVIGGEKSPGTKTVEKAVIAGGCFWCTEAVFESVKGVSKVVSGYSGGDAATAKYDIIGTGKTQHTEAIEITYDPRVISFGQILKIFFAVAHDPTQVNRQGPDWGPQYRSAIHWADAEQEKIAKAYVKQLEEAKVFGKPIATELAPLKKFYPAEGYHQDFVKNNPYHPYVVVNSTPKVEKLKKEFPELYRKW